MKMLRKINEEERLACALVAAQERIAELIDALAERDRELARLRAAEHTRLARELRDTYSLPAAFAWSQIDGVWTLTYDVATEARPEATKEAPPAP